MSIQDTDKCLVNRSGSSYQVPVSNLTGIGDADLILVNRSGVSYKATGADIKQYVYRFGATLSSQSSLAYSYNVTTSGNFNGTPPSGSSVQDMFDGQTATRLFLNVVNPQGTINFSTPAVANTTGNIIFGGGDTFGGGSNNVKLFLNGRYSAGVGIDMGSFTNGSTNNINVSNYINAGEVITQMTLQVENLSTFAKYAAFTRVSLSGVSNDWTIGPAEGFQQPVLNFPAGTDFRLLSVGDTVTQASGASGVIGEIGVDKLILSSSSGTWVAGQTILGPIS